MSKLNVIRLVATLITLASLSFTACAARAPLRLLDNPPCSNARGVVWVGPEASDHRERLSEWCRTVGEVIVSSPNNPPLDIVQSGLIIVTWNKHEDYGDLQKLLRSVVGKFPVVALLQEVSRVSETVPLDVPSSMHVPRRIGPKGQAHHDITSIAEEFSMSLIYLPSMPNGLRTQEDRGCAILTTLPISDVIGIELPWVSQRRVAVMATVTALTSGVPWRCRVVSMHLDNRLGRGRQAAAVADFLAKGPSSNLPTLIGGDLNSWSGIADRAVKEIDRVIPRIRACDNRPTFQFLFFALRLDHFFMTLPPDIPLRCYVEPDKFGSDHHPILLHLFKDS